MDNNNTLASGDNNNAQQKNAKCVEDNIDESKSTEMPEHVIKDAEKIGSFRHTEDITVQKIEDNEVRLKDRITQCKNIIESLKFELNEEKAKFEREIKAQRLDTPRTIEASSTLQYKYYDMLTPDDLLGDLAFSTNLYDTCVDKKLNCDENIIEYEKQLEKYQNTLNMAQIEKKNAIRKQMLAKAYRLKLLEVENQCNIELLRVKQSLQCLEPLQMIASKWKTDADDASFSLDKFELMPRISDVSDNNGNAAIEIESIKDEPAIKTEESAVKDCVISDL